VRAGNLRREQVLAVRVLAVRRDGFAGAIHLSAEGLPAGVLAEPCVVGNGQTEGTLLLRADGDAPKWAGAVHIVGRAQIDGTEQTRRAQPWTPLWESTVSSFVESVRNRRTTEMALAVVDEAPLGASVWAEPREIACKSNEKVTIGLRLQSTSRDTPTLKFKPAGLPGLDKAKLKDAETAAASGTGNYELDIAALKLNAGTYTLWFRGELKTKRTLQGAQTDATVPLLSNAVTVTVK
jgi:hypothetical protein